ncbi:hypothetical protein NUW54_g12978 [Trametes sanguinea]|uniref:Uncharacterized protein n=1 Tax=Trametes sanguinea TaxID=158606 RepID=A0ACC1MQX7_9APHY|nr:hypothetical protein NUW54_g12978 [Trametes sanguinea]
MPPNPPNARVLERQASAVLCSTSTRWAGRALRIGQLAAQRGPARRPSRSPSLNTHVRIQQRTRARPAKASPSFLRARSNRTLDPSARHVAAMYTSLEAPERSAAAACGVPCAPAYVRMWLWLWKVASGEWRIGEMGTVGRAWVRRGGPLGWSGRAGACARGSCYFYLTPPSSRPVYDVAEDEHNAATYSQSQVADQVAVRRVHAGPYALLPCVPASSGRLADQTARYVPDILRSDRTHDGRRRSSTAAARPSMHSGQAQAGFSSTSVSSLRGRPPARHTQNQRPFTHLLNDRGEHVFAGWSSWAGAAQQPPHLDHSVQHRHLSSLTSRQAPTTSPASQPRPRARKRELQAASIQRWCRMVKVP